ncbi:MAG: citramalate synthase [Akkermansia sp.]
MKKIEIYDTSLRDGAQSEGINFSAQDKIKIVHILDELGVEYIEAGWPGANPKDADVFKLLRDIPLQNSQICAFGCTRKAHGKVEEDKVLQELIAAQTPIVTIFGKSWDFQVEHALGVSLAENLAMIGESVAYLKAAGKKVFFDAEHYFDGYKANPQYALAALQAAHQAGAERLILCDTNGGCIYNEIEQITQATLQALPEAQLGIHAHNDSDTAISNSLAAVVAGAIQVQGTINGYGERCGNANLCSVIPNLQLKLGYQLLGDKIEQLVRVAHEVSEIANKKLYRDTPFVGPSAFTHKAGIHASGVIKNSATYEHISPEQVGNVRRILLSDQAGLASLKNKIQHLKLGINIPDEKMPQVISYIKEQEWKGFSFENADASFELMLMDWLGQQDKLFEFLGFRLITDTFRQRMDGIAAEGTVKLRVGEQLVHTVADGNGPVEAIDRALRLALREYYPEIDSFKLSDYKVRILDGRNGTEAKTRVHIETTNGVQRWDTMGVSQNITEASCMAIVDSIHYGLLLGRA